MGLGLAPDYTGCGLGEAFVREGIAFALLLHPEKRKIVLDVLRENERAIKVYERVGFVRTGERDALSYGKPIVFATMQLIV